MPSQVIAVRTLGGALWRLQRSQCPSIRTAAQPCCHLKENVRGAWMPLRTTTSSSLTGGTCHWLNKPQVGLSAESGKRTVVASAGPPSGQSSGVATEGESTVPNKSTVVRRRKAVGGPAPEQAETVSVEDKRVTVEGVAKVDRGDDDFSLGRAALLVGGDVAALTLFAWIGMSSHGGGPAAIDAALFETAWPFVAGWLVAASLLGGYGAPAQGSKGLGGAAFAAAKSWAVGIPIGLVVRGLVKGHVPPQPFVLVTLGATLLLLVGWRSAFSFTAARGLAKRRGDRRGNIFEFFDLLSSLTRRW